MLLVPQRATYRHFNYRIFQYINFNFPDTGVWRSHRRSSRGGSTGQSALGTAALREAARHGVNDAGRECTRRCGKRHRCDS